MFELFWCRGSSRASPKKDRQHQNTNRRFILRTMTYQLLNRTHRWPDRSTARRILTRAALLVAAGLIGGTAPAQSASDALSAAADKGRILGSEKATVWMLVVSDFQCPYCKVWHEQTWAAIRNEYVTTGKIRVAFMHFPLGQHPNARPMAIAAMCASAQGKFWPMTESLFKAQDRWKDLKDSRPFTDSVGKTLSLDATKLKACMDAPSVAKLVEADRMRMARVGAESTPTFFIGSRKLAGAQTIVEFRKAIDAELAAAKPR
ncbi:MAG: hypothetical protein CK531_05020 [Gemmatimonadetes bacterium]|nr:MAG: hypothetical protein CK531_05020 [Gemmatimonadota bacterium]